MAYASKTMVTAFASAIAALLITQSATAVTPTAVWDCAVAGQELNTTQGGLTISAGYGNTVSNGKIVIAGQDSYGASITLNDTSSVSLLVKYSNFSSFSSKDMTYPPVFASVIDSDNHEIGLFATNDATEFNFYWQQRGPQTMPWEDRHSVGSGIALPSAGSGYFLFSYSATSGVRLYIGNNLSALTGAENSGYHFSNKTISSISFGGPENWTYNDAWPNLVIEKVALFKGEYLSASAVADFSFPSEVGMFRSDVTVTEINNAFGSESEITVRLADGVTVTGDTTFNASKVNFHCNGEFIITPPASNRAEFVFVEGTPVVEYSGALPSVAGECYTSNSVPESVANRSSWNGVISLKSISGVTNFDVNKYGNVSSLVRLSDISGWLKTQNNAEYEYYVPVELVGPLNITNGNSANDDNHNRCTAFRKLSGNGTINTDSTAPRVVIVIHDASEFTGSLGLNGGKFIVFGATMPDYTTLTNTTVGTIFVMPGATVTNNGFWWATGGKVIVGGELRASDLSKFGGGTYIETTDTGVFTLVSNGNGDELETDTDYARITGTGSLKYEGSGWRALSANNFPTSMTLINERENDILLSRSQTYTVGSLAGSKNFQGNYGSGNRYLRILQAKDTEWSGLNNPDGYYRLAGFIVASGVSSAGTLTLSGTQTQRTTLTVESGAKVNLTGTWVGATTVAGTLGGTGNLTGDLTLSDGATLKVADMSDALAVSGSLTATGAITIDLPDGTTSGMIIGTGSAPNISGARFTVTVGGKSSKLKIVAKDNGLKAVTPPLTIHIR